MSYRDVGGRQCDRNGKAPGEPKEEESRCELCGCCGKCCVCEYGLFEEGVPACRCDDAEILTAAKDGDK